MGVARKRKEQAEDIYKWTPDIEFEQNRSVGLGAILPDRQKFKNYGFFSGKADSVIFLGLECSIKPEYLIKIVEPFLRNSKF